MTYEHMKSLTIKLTAVLMVCIYIVGIAGLDVHSCHHSHECHHGHHYLPHSNEGHEKINKNDCCSNTYHALELSGSGDGHRLVLNCFPVALSQHTHCCRDCRDCRMASTGMMAELGLIDGVPLHGYSFIGKLFSVFRI